MAGGASGRAGSENQPPAHPMPMAWQRPTQLTGTSGGEGLTHRAQAAGLAVVSAREVFELAARGEGIARRLIAEMTDALGHQVAAAVQVVNPDVLVIGGGIAQAGDALIVPVVAALHRYAQPSHTRRLRVVPAELGNRAGVVGAGLMAWGKVLSV